MKLAVVTDSTATLPPEISNHRDLFVLPIPVVIDGEMFHEDLDLNLEEFSDRIQKSQSFPTTSQPSLGEVLTLYQEISEKGYDTVLAIHLSSGISGFLKNIQTLSSETLGLQVQIFDSQITANPMGTMVETALVMKEEGADIQKILKKLTSIRKHTKAYMIVDDLNHLVRGGRLNGGAAKIGSLLKIKPILTFTDGNIVLEEKIRTSNRAFQKTMELIEERVAEFPENTKFFVIHFDELEKAKEIVAQLEEKYPQKDITLSNFGPVVATHLGKGAIGIGINEY